MKIGLYGGSFDPITNGHINVIINLLKYFDQVWIMPCYKSLAGKNLVESKHRINMCEIAISSINDNRVKIFDFEIKNKLTCSSIEIMMSIYKKYPKNNFYFIMGMDVANGIFEWDNYEQILKVIKFCIIPRFGYKSLTDWYKNKPHLFIDIELKNISSTKRKNTRCSEKNIINQKILEYIETNNLYAR